MTEKKPVATMEKSQTMLGKKDNAPSGASAALFVLLQQPQGNDKSGPGILGSDQDAGSSSTDAPAITSVPSAPKSKACLAADCKIGDITVVLDNNTMWNEFYRRSTEMILTKQGRRMFPYCRYWITGLDPNLKYILVMDIVPVDNQRYKWNGRWWEPSGKAEPHVLGRVFIHPESPSTGQYWMHQPVSFYKLKLTNNYLDQEGHIILHSMHRYLPRLHLVPADRATEVIQLNGPDVHTFTFPQTEFFAVTAYQNIQITQLKIDYNPFAKGFREDALVTKPFKDVLARVRSDLEVASDSTLSSTHRQVENHGTNSLKKDEGSLVGSHEKLDSDIEKNSFNAERDFLTLINTGVAVEDVKRLKQENLDSTQSSGVVNCTRTTSPLESSGPTDVVIKEELVDDYDYDKTSGTVGVVVKEENSEEEYTDEYSNSDESYPILERQLMKQSAMDRASRKGPCKRTLKSSSEVSKAKILKLECGKMPVMDVETCNNKTDVSKAVSLEEDIVLTGKEDKLLDKETHLSASVEESLISSINSSESKGSESIEHKAKSKRSMPTKAVGNNSESSRDFGKPETPILFPRDSADSPLLAKVTKKRKSTPTLKYQESLDCAVDELTPPVSPVKRGRPRKTKFNKVGRQPKKSFGKHLDQIQEAIPAKNSAFSNANLDLEDVDGVLFVSFVSKEALDIHTVDVPVVGKGLQSALMSSAFEKTDDGRKIVHLEKQLLEDLKSLRHKQVIHPALQEVGLKLGVVDPTMSIDLRYLGVQLPLPYFSTSGLEDDSVPDPGQSFISRTGKTTDFTKIKGWRDKFSTNTSSNSEGGVSGAPMKNRSAFCSDKLDEYLENEAKLMESDLDLPPDVAPPINYQLPTKSTSYVRTLDSVLKKQSASFPFGTEKTLSSPPVRKKVRGRSKSTSSSTKGKRVYRRILPSTGRVKEKFNLQSVLTKASSNPPGNMIHRFLLPALDENMLPKQINLAQAQQQQQQNSARFPGVSKSYLKLIDLEECAVWDGKPRTFITEERADISLATLLTAQVSLKSKPVHKIIRRRAPACNNEFCRLGCICASISQERREPTHCRRPECMFGCTCLKRKMMLVRGGPKDTTTIKKEDDDSLLSESFGEGPQLPHKEEELESEEDENYICGSHQLKKVKLEYTICDTEPEEPVRKCFSIWEKGENDEDPEPIYIPKPSVNEHAHSGALEYTSSSRSKPGRIYTPKPNPVVRDEDKDPVYLYFENMMTCARVRAYERKTKERMKKEMLDQCTCGSSQCISTEHYTQHQQKGAVSRMEKVKGNSTDKSWRLAHSKTNISTSRVHKITSGGPTKLIEIISDCNWEEDRNTILNILSQQIKSNMPRSLKVGNFIVELASESKNRDEKQPPFVSSRVKISMPSYQEKDEEDEMSELENSDIKAETAEFPHDETSDILPKKSPGCKGLPFYSGLSPAGRLVANMHAPDSNASGLIQVNGKSYPQAKLLLGQMGALHPANRLAAYITGRLRPTVLDLSTLSTVISKVSSSSKTSTPLTTVTTPTTKPTVTFTSSSNTESNPPTLTFTAARPSPGGMFTQFVVNKAGSLQQKIPVVGTAQPVSGTQKFSVSPTSYVVVTPVATSRSCQVFTTTPTTRISTLPTPSSTLSAPVFTAATLISKVNTNEVVSPTTTPAKNSTITLVSPPKLQSAAGFGVTLTSQTINTTSPTTVSSATVTTTKATVKFPTTPVTPLTPLSFARTIVNTSAIPFPVTTTTSASLAATTKATSFVSTSSSTSGSTINSVPILLSGINSLSQKPVAGSQASVAISSTPVLSPGTEKRIGPRLLLIPVPAASPSVRPARNVQLAQGQKMVLQPFRNPGGVNLFRHPNGQIVQLVPLQQLRAAGSQPKAQPLMLRNPGSVMGIQLPLTNKIPDTSKQLPASTSPFVLSSPVVSTKVASVVSSTDNAISNSAASVSSVPSFVSQAGTLTLRISPPTSSSIAPGQSSANSKIITYSSAGQPMGSASLVPLQSGSFALLQLPGQKPVPSSILNHAASLQLLKDTKTANQKEQQDLNGQPDSKTSPSEEEAATVGEKMLLESECESDEKQVASVTNLAENLQTGLPDASVHKINDKSQCGTLDNATDHKLRLSKNIVETDIREQESPYPKEINEFKEQKVGLDSYNEEQVENSSFSDSECAVQHSSFSADCSTVVSKNCADAGDPVELANTREQNRKESNNDKENIASATSLCPTNNEANNQIDKPNEPVHSDGNGNTTKQYGNAEDCFSQLGDHENHVNTEQTCCQEQMENKLEPTSKKVESEISEDHVTDNLATGTSYVAETKSQLGSKQGFNNILEENRGSDEGFALSRNVKSSPSLVSEHISNIKKETSISLEEYGESSSQPCVTDIKTEPGQLKKTLVLINIDKEEFKEEDDKSDDSADDLMADGSSEEEVNVDVNEFVKVDEEHVDIETVEELSETFNIARLKAKAAYIGSSRQQCNFHNLLADKDKKVSNWKKKTGSEANPFKYYRETHTANERRRRLEMRTLFENLQKMLGLNLPKVSKSFILTQAYEEIQGLTDQADKLIGQKNLLTRKQDILIHKVSALSGKTEEVVLKKLEYIYAKQKALDAQRKKRQKGEEELAQQLRPSRLLKQELSLESLKHVEQLTLSNHNRLKPLILARKQQQVGITSMVIQLPGSSVPIQLKGIITNPVTLSTTTVSTIAPTMPRAAQLPTENDALFMMPKIVNVTSLANEPGVSLKLRIDKTPASASTIVKAADKTLRHEANIDENTLGKLAPVPGRGVMERCEMGSSSSGTQVAIIDRDLISKQVLNLESTNKAPVNRLPEITSLAALHGERKVESEQLTIKDSPFLKLLSKDAKDLMDVELQRGASSAEEIALHATELMSGIDEHDDTDETLTSLLNEIAFLNQQLNNDTPNLSDSPKFSLGDTVAGGNEIAAGDAPSVQFSSLRELLDEKETRSSESPLLLQLEQSDFHTGVKQPGEPSSGDTLNAPGVHKSESSQLSIKDRSVSSHFIADTANASPPPILQKKSKQEVGSTDNVWRPMPKLAPLGLKVSHLPADQEGQANKVMPPLAPVTTKLGPPWAKTAVPAAKRGQINKAMPVLSSVVAKQNDSALPSTITDK
ncbi:MAX gene-associated protein isoform X2 [Pleurodeles waltl]|uniref:MAX gene-associated protein isoform X2 n=1 Tax=Pleurodeles waltl TaxID=8319 RepID=UPI0037098BF7